MKPAPRKMVFTDLENILNSVHSALQSTNFNSLSDLVVAQNRAISDLASKTNEQLVLTLPEVRVLHQLADRNRRILEATMRGIKSASRRRREVEEASRSTQTYDRSGRRAALDPPQKNDFKVRR